MIVERLKRALPYAVVLAAGLYLFHVANQIEYFAPSGRIGPDAWPKIVISLLIAASVYGIVRALTRAGAQNPAAEALVEGPAEEPHPSPAEADKTYPGLLLLGVLATLAYVALVPTLGFFLATSTYLIAFMVIGRYRNWPVIFSTGILGALLMMFFFMRVVYISLPIGKEPFSAVTLFLMKVMGIK
ncbi:tripartite tricarboxylate transporter TctB family protein [Pelomicrobium sp.]|jgi:putative tricarboxylic transport membrane protein|uniref:tripartite tricarboxylate transporter TctB family protein n=1 Tax=Pelomicrobium sp. TaxID=2815319 RepID=UPI002FDCFDBC